MTDMYDEWDEGPDDFQNYRHQRRLSDPSANLNNYSRYGWKTKPNTSNEHSSKAMSQNEGLDSLANEVSEIEAGDLKDGKFLFVLEWIFFLSTAECVAIFQSRTSKHLPKHCSIGFSDLNLLCYTLS